MPHLLLRLLRRKVKSESLLPMGELDNLQLLETLSCSIYRREVSSLQATELDVQGLQSIPSRNSAGVDSISRCNVAPT